MLTVLLGLPAFMIVAPGAQAGTVAELRQKSEQPFHRYAPKPEPVLSPAARLLLQEKESDLSVLTRKNDAYDALTLRAGDFLLAPSLDIGAQYNDNIFARDGSPIGDYIYTVAPKLTLNSDFVQNQLGAEFYAEKAKYQDNGSEDFLDYGGKLKGRYDLSGDTSIPASLGLFHDHVRRSSPDGRAGLEPTEFDLLQAQTGLTHNGQTLAYSVTGQYDQFTFDDVPALGGLTVNNADRDRKETSGGVKFGMANEAVIVPFVYGNARDVQYDQTVDDFGFERSSFNFGYGGGSLFNISQVLRFTLTAGMLHRRFDDPRFSSTDKPVYALQLTWEPTPMLAFQASGERTIEETTIIGLSSSLDDRFTALANYEFAPNLSLAARAEYLQKDYDGLVQADLEQYLGDVSLTYKLNRNAWASFGYQYTTQSASGTNQLTDFDRNIVSANLHLQI